MAKGYTFLDFAKEVLEISQKPLAFMDIWKIGVEKGFDKKLTNNTGQTPWQTLCARIYTDMKKPDSIFYFYSRKPTLFWLKDKELPKNLLLHSEKQETK